MHMRTLVLVAAALAAAVSCSGSNNPTPDAGAVPDAGPTPDAGVTPDAGPPDAGPFSACGHPGDQGNAIGVGKYCQQISDCPGTAQICTTIQNGLQPPNMQSYFCTTSCDCTTSCGSNALCVCTSAGCGCVPSTCSALIPDGGILHCDAGTPDGGDGG